MWRGLAEVAEKYLKKGQSVFIEGKIRSNQYQDKEGVQRYNTEIVADSMTMLGGKSDNSNGDGNYQGSSSMSGSSNASSGSNSNASAFQNNEPDDLPF